VAFSQERLLLYARVVAERQRGASAEQAAQRAGLALSEARDLADCLHARLDGDPLLAERFQALVANAVAAERVP
jgi:hypothetical protein